MLLVAAFWSRIGIEPMTGSSTSRRYFVACWPPFCQPRVALLSEEVESLGHERVRMPRKPFQDVFIDRFIPDKSFKNAGGVESEEQLHHRTPF